MISTKTQIVERISLILIPLLLIISFVIIRNHVVLPKTKYYKIENYYKGSLEHKSSYNDYIPKYITKENLVIRIFNDYKYKMINEPKKAYKLISKKSDNKSFSDYTEFEQIINKKDSGLIYSEIKKYNSELSKAIVIDQFNNKYIFEITNPIDYTVSIEVNN